MYELSPLGSVVFSKNQTTRQQQLLSSVTRRISGLQTTKLYTLTLPSGQRTESSLNSPFDLQETEHSPQITYQVTSQVTAWSHSYFSITAVDTHMGSSSSSSTLEVPPALILMGCSQLLLRLKESDLPTAFSLKQRNLSSRSPSALLILRRSMIKKKGEQDKILQKKRMKCSLFFPTSLQASDWCCTRATPEAASLLSSNGSNPRQGVFMAFLQIKRNYCAADGWNTSPKVPGDVHICKLIPHCPKPSLLPFPPAQPNSLNFMMIQNSI